MSLHDRDYELNEHMKHVYEHNEGVERKEYIMYEDDYKLIKNIYVDRMVTIKITDLYTMLRRSVIPHSESRFIVDQLIEREKEGKNGGSV